MSRRAHLCLMAGRTGFARGQAAVSAGVRYPPCSALDAATAYALVRIELSAHGYRPRIWHVYLLAWWYRAAMRDAYQRRYMVGWSLGRRHASTPRVFGQHARV